MWDAARTLHREQEAETSGAADRNSHERLSRLPVACNGKTCLYAHFSLRQAGCFRSTSGSRLTDDNSPAISWWGST